MDLLKILSRGTSKTATQPTVVPKQPKSGNPQLYHDAARGVKRKRAKDASQNAVTAGDVTDEVGALVLADHQEERARDPRDQPIPQANSEPSVLGEAEVRQVLRAHRLKYTVLSSHRDKSVKVKGSKLKSKSKSKSKDDKTQIYPQPLTSFNALRSLYNISSRLADNIAKHGYRIPTEVQLGSLPLLLNPAVALRDANEAQLKQVAVEDVDFLAVAPTGSGKTLAFLIPTISAAMRRRAESGQADKHSLDAIILAPTRELARQITNEGRKLATGTGVKVTLFRKGMSVPAETAQSNGDKESGSSDQDEEDNHGSPEVSDSDGAPAKEQVETQPVTNTDVLVTTPLLFLKFLRRRTKTKKTLPTVRSLILDEGDALLDPLFRDQTMAIWSSCTHELLRLSCWSATMGSSVESLLLEQLGKRGEKRPSALFVRLVVGLKDTAVPSVRHRLVYTGENEQDKLFAIRQLIHPNSAGSSVPALRFPFLVFVQTIDRTTSLHQELKFDIRPEAGGPARIASLHSSMSESARSATIARFRAGEIWMLITTDLLMRGIDFRGVNGVVNYDMPTSAAAYVHRVGRTGRAGHEGGLAVTFYTKEDVPYLKNIANVIALSERQAGREADETVPKWLMAALPRVNKDDKKQLKERGVEWRRGSKAHITSEPAWVRRKENNRRAAIASSKRRKLEGQGRSRPLRGGEESEWSGIED